MTFLTNLTVKIPYRATVAIWVTLATIVLYVVRTSFSISLQAMIQSQNHDENGNLIQLPNRGPRYNWDQFEQSLILGGIFIGNSLTALPFGVLINIFGFAKLTVIGSFIMWSILTFLTPLAAADSFVAIFSVRILFGMCGAAAYPCYQIIINYWAPPNERGKFTSCLIFGGDIGVIIPLLMSGVLIESYGWEWSFYVPAIMSALFALASFWLVYDSPDKHPRITATELAYIQISKAGIITGRKKDWPPFGAMLISLPYLSLVLLQFGQFWGTHFLVTSAPKFINEILGLNLSTTGFLLSLPFIVRVFSAIGFGILNDYLTKIVKPSNKSFIRKGACVMSHIAPGLSLLAIRLVSDNPTWCLALLTLSYGLTGSSCMSGFVNQMEIAPNFTGIISSMNGFITSIPGFLSPMVVAYYIRENNTIDEWNTIFMVVALIYIVPALVFMIFGSVKIQKWNEILPKTTSTKL